MNREINPQIYARAGGILYLLIIIIGFTEEFFIRGRIMVAGDATATFANLQKMEMLWRTGIARLKDTHATGKFATIVFRGNESENPFASHRL